MGTVNSYKIRFFLLSLFIFFLLFLTSIGEAAKLRVRVIVQGANIRMKPTIESTVILQAPLGAILKSEEKIGNWYKVNLPPDESGFIVSGYIHENMLEIIEEIKKIPEEIKPKEVEKIPEVKEKIEEKKPPEITPSAVKKHEVRKEKVIGISFRGGFYSPSSKLLNNELISPINQYFKDLASSSESDWGFAVNLDEVENIKANSIYGIEIEFFIISKISFLLSAEYWKKNSSGLLNISGDWWGNSYDITQNYGIEVFIIPIVGSLRLNVPYKRFNFFVGGGAGYYLSEIKINFNEDWKENGTSYFTYDYDIKARGDNIIPLINGGVGFEITSNISIVADFRYPLGKIKSFKIKKSTRGDKEGEELTYVVDGKESLVSLELDGINLGIMLKLMF